MFPGQGAQYVGMGKEFFAKHEIARETFAKSDEVLGFSLSQIFMEGPEEELRLTYHTQPALLTMSLTAYRIFTNEMHIEPMVAAGHSLGEYSALVAIGALSFESAVKLVHARGRWMDEAVPSGQGAMAAILGLDETELENVCSEIRLKGEIVELANLNCPGQIVISGSAMGVEMASELARNHGARRSIPLVVSGPFHSSLMKPAAERLTQALRDTEFFPARVPLIANVDANLHQSPDEIRAVLERQLYSSVRWHQSVELMIAMGVDTFIEFGPGTVLSGLIKKTNRKINTLHIEDEASLLDALAACRDAGF